ncbi:MAG: hypothetical protein CVU42_10465 [Chloroflexi bacterium HGW-Chloroflexi-4]|jgi:hypothetical protein|nr:MAG: hypothetical protein CVU42_10465 [Chloroflexi bacterium HGW-Chloroflexi-4]
MVYYNSKILKHNANIPHKNTQVQITELIHIFHKKIAAFCISVKKSQAYIENQEDIQNIIQLVQPSG